MLNTQMCRSTLVKHPDLAGLKLNSHQMSTNVLFTSLTILDTAVYILQASVLQIRFLADLLSCASYWLLALDFSPITVPQESCIPSEAFRTLQSKL